MKRLLLLFAIAASGWAQITCFPCGGSNAGGSLTPAGSTDCPQINLGGGALGCAYFAGGGTANAQTITLSPAITSLVAGLTVYWLPSNANTTTTPTLAVNGLTATTITKYGSRALAAGDLSISAVAFAIYDGTFFELQNPQTGGTTLFTCQPGLGDGLNAIPAGTYLQSTCWNKSGVTLTITTIQCYTDNAGSSTLNATDGTGTALLTGAVTCSSTIATGTLGSTTTIANNGFFKFTFVADGSSKQTSWVVAGSY